MSYSILERAFQLAQNGPSANLSEIRALLHAEGYSDAVAQTSFPTLRKQLRDAIQKRLGVSSTPGIQARPRIKGVLHLSG